MCASLSACMCSCQSKSSCTIHGCQQTAGLCNPGDRQLLCITCCWLVLLPDLQHTHQRLQSRSLTITDCTFPFAAQPPIPRWASFDCYLNPRRDLKGRMLGTLVNNLLFVDIEKDRYCMSFLDNLVFIWNKKQKQTLCFGHISLMLQLWILKQRNSGTCKKNCSSCHWVRKRKLSLFQQNFIGWIHWVDSF